jgi:hypothetical protein
MTRGELGEAGSPGIGGGGEGGRGGRGGTASTRHWIWVALFAAIVAVGLSVGTLLLANDVRNNNAEITRLQRQDRAIARHENARQDQVDTQAREAEYRICVRQQVTRAFLILDQVDEGRDDVAKLPLYDCRPNLVGGPAKRLTPAERQRFLRSIRTATNPDLAP